MGSAVTSAKLYTAHESMWEAGREGKRTDMERSATEFAEVFKFRFGAEVTTDDGEVATLREVVVDPEQRMVIGVGIKFGMFGGIQYVAYQYLLEAAPENIRLKLQRGQIEHTAAEKTAFLTVTSRTQVQVEGRRIGMLAQATVNRASGTFRHFVVSRGVRNEVVLPAVDVASIESRLISVKPAVLGATPILPYRPDNELRDAVRERIESFDRMRIDLPGIVIHVIDGVVWLKGYVSSELNRRIVEDLVSGTTGIAELHNELIPDNLLAADVSMALARTAATSQEKIGVYPALGVVRLRGFVSSDEKRKAVAEVARSVPGVKAIENELHVNPNVTVLPVLAGVTGDEDVVPGGD